MIRADTKRKLAAAGLFVLPVGLVLATGAILGGPNVVRGTLTPAPATVPLTKRAPGVAPTEAQISAIMRVVAQRDEPYGPAPLYFTPREPRAFVTETGPVNPEFRVQAILASSRGNAALINGQAYRVGDALGETGWFVESIDAITRTVVARDGESDRTIEQSVELPGYE